MKNNILLFFSFLLLDSCIIPYNPKKNDTYVLKESFVENDNDWIEETTDYHELKIKNGHYFIYSKDTSFSYTSTSPLNNSFLFGLKNFELETSFDFAKLSPNKSQYGLFFVSGILRYNFILDYDGTAIVTENDNVKSSTTTLTEKKLKNFYHRNDIPLKIIINDYRYSFYIDDTLVGEGDLKSGSWQDLRIFVSSGTKVMINSFSIKKI